MMLKLLKQQWPTDRLESAFAAVELSPKIRAEAVTLEQFVRLTGLLAAPSAA
jgi:16S rRNA A1518/A1519 N6-dimethyltransferase RsmA/KsgA/DIM1 with predicted DNA glycosylase/AP lyase activity